MEKPKMRTFKITDKYVGNSMVKRTVINFRWTRRTGLECEMWPGKWVKSGYTLREFTSGMEGGHFIETT